MDEIVVIDTGSSDRTVEIAKEHGALIFHFPWCDDFSAARNESLRYATSDWLLWIDADEELIQREPGSLRALVSHPGRSETSIAPPNSQFPIPNSSARPKSQLPTPNSRPWGFYLETHCPVSEDEHEARAIVQQWRLFPNRRGIHFEGRVHEHPVSPEFLPATAVQVQQEIRIQHWGYLPDAERLPRKLERNRRLIELSIASEPHQPRHYFNLGQHYLAQDDYQAALPVFRDAIEHWFVGHGADLGYVPAMFAGAARSAVELGQFALALEIEAQTPADLISSELLLESGTACQELGLVDEAIARLTRAGSDPLALGNVLLDRTCQWRALLALARIHQQQGQLAEAETALAKARELAPAEVEVLAQIQNSSGLGTRDSELRISACMIVRDEETDLPRCLESLRDKVDEIVVVDTGSTDRTVEIARAYGARVSYFTWCDDFSAARNESLRHASGDFIIWVDADDELIESEPGALRQLIQGNDNPTASNSQLTVPNSHWGYWVDVFCPTDEWGEGEAILKQARVFRNHAGVRFSGRIHEQVVPPEIRDPTQDSGPRAQGSGLRFQDSISIRHWGYIPSGNSASVRSERNLRLARLAIDEHPEDPFPRYNLGLQLAADRDYQRALEALEQAITLWAQHPSENDGYVPAMFSTAAFAAVEIPLHDTVLRIEAQTPARYVTSELLMHAGVAWWRLGRHHEALERFQKAAAGTGIHPNNHDRSSTTWRPALLQACVYADIGQFEPAYTNARRSLEFAPTRPETLFVLAHVSQQLGKREESLSWARQLLAGSRDDGYKPQVRGLMLRMANEVDDAALALEALSGPVDKLSDAETVVVQARAYAMLGQIQQQFETLDAGCRDFPENASIRLELAELLEAQGYDTKAINALGAGLDAQDAPAELYQRLAKLLARQGRLEDASNALRIAKLKQTMGAANPAPAGV